MSIEFVMSSSLLILCHPLLLPSIFPSIRVFSNKLALHISWPKYWSPNFSISSNEYLGLISFRIDWFDLLAAQETLKNLLQHHNLKASVLQSSSFFMVQLSHLYVTTGKTTSLTTWTFVGKVMSLLFNTQSRFVIAFLSRSKCLLISWLKSPSAVILEPKEKKIYHCFYFFPYLLALKWWDQIPWSYIAGSYGNSMVNLWETAKLFSKVNVAFYIPTSNVWQFCILHILSKTCYCLSFFFNYSHPSGYEVVSCSFDLYFPDS